MKNIVDSCGWLEYFADTINADNFAKVIEDTDNLLVPTITIMEVFKVVMREKNESLALEAVALMKQGEVVDLNEYISLESARMAISLKMPMADSIVYATGKVKKAIIWTQDNDFEGKDGVKYFKKK